jgi:ABC-type branched-subunit amino acid transport system ATPase component
MAAADLQYSEAIARSRRIDLMIEQNARAALEMSYYGIVLERGQTRLTDRAERILGDSRIGQLFLGGAMAESAAARIAAC